MPAYLYSISNHVLPFVFRFVDSEGWPTLNAWLAEYKRQSNTSMLIEMLELLQKLPVTIAALKKVRDVAHTLMTL